MDAGPVWVPATGLPLGVQVWDAAHPEVPASLSRALLLRVIRASVIAKAQARVASFSRPYPASSASRPFPAASLSRAFQRRGF